MNSTSKRSIGLHCRLISSYTDLITKALKTKPDILQFLLLPEKKQYHLNPIERDLKEFLNLSKNVRDIYIHSSFKINLATGNKKQRKISKFIFEKEINIAKQLNARYLVLHPGHAAETTKDKAIRSLIKIINEILKQEANITLLLENDVYSKQTIGGDLEDFIKIRKLIANPNKIKFCVDFAHAFAYGYDIHTIEEFVALLDETMGTNNIQLIHLNDSLKKMGSEIDQHAPPGRGKIGKETLQKLINHPKLKHIPVIIESSLDKDHPGIQIVEEVRQW